MSISVIYTPHHRMPLQLYDWAVKYLIEATHGNEFIIVWDHVVIVNGEHYTRTPPDFQSKHHMMYAAIMAGLEYASGDIVYPHCEADCLYPMGHFTDDVVNGQVCYTRNMWRFNNRGAWEDNRWPSLSGMCADKETAIEALTPFLKKAEQAERIRWSEPGLEDNHFTWVERPHPYLDVRWGGNITGYRDSPNAQDMIPYWGDHTKMCKRLRIAKQ